MANQRSEYGRSRSMDKRLKAMGKPMPDQPKESLEVPDILRVHENPDTTAHHQTGPHDECECRVCVLQRQNAALVSALRNLMLKVSDELTGPPKIVPKSHWAAEWDAAVAVLAPYAPAEAKAQEKP